MATTGKDIMDQLTGFDYTTLSASDLKKLIADVNERIRTGIPNERDSITKELNETILPKWQYWQSRINENLRYYTGERQQPHKWTCATRDDRRNISGQVMTTAQCNTNNKLTDASYDGNVAGQKPWALKKDAAERRLRELEIEIDTLTSYLPILNQAQAKVSENNSESDKTVNEILARDGKTQASVFMGAGAKAGGDLMKTEEVVAQDRRKSKAKIAILVTAGVLAFALIGYAVFLKIKNKKQ